MLQALLAQLVSQDSKAHEGNQDLLANHSWAEIIPKDAGQEDDLIGLWLT